MNFAGDPIAYFESWLAEPIPISGEPTVQAVLDALNRHPIAQDESAQDYIMPARRYRETAERFQIYGENQDTWYCFVREGNHADVNPPVYFHTCLDLVRDHGFSPEDVLGDNYVLVSNEFRRFVWHMLAHQICLRLEPNEHYQAGVNGIVFSRPLAIDATLENPLGAEFPAGFSCHLSESTICIPDWGAAFRDDDTREAFVRKFSPEIKRKWA